MHIVFAASECAPWAKTGGLADVVSALPRTLARLGHKVSVFIPYYRQVAKAVPNPPVVLPSVTIPFPSYNRFVRVLNGGVDAGVQTYFIDCPELFDRESLYATPSGDYPDNAERFGLLSRAVIEASKMIEVPDVFHVHDWQTAMLAVLLRSTYYFDPVFRHVPAVLTIHNAGYQGWFPPQTMEKLLLPWDMFTFDKLVEEDMVLTILGNGEEYYERLLVEMANRHPAKVRVHGKFDNVMAHKIEAGADIFLMPSRYEPGGLNQIYSLKYGTIPVVRATGGLDDTIDEQPNGGNGFK